MESRNPSPEERRLIDFLINTASIKPLDNWKERLIVKPLNDGGMGSLSLSTRDSFDANRKFGKQISECFFIDSDGVKVIASLYVDENNELYELDIWKVDYSPVLTIPLVFDAGV